MLNLKGLPVKLNSDEPKVLTLSVSGAREVTAADIAPDADVEILDPSYRLCDAVVEGREAVDGDRRREAAAAT